ncbi:MAG: esterase [Deltaproteobacteria bacterium]|nr:esterase [Deltaproteobacteria bacterium]
MRLTAFLSCLALAACGGSRPPEAAGPSYPPPGQPLAGLAVGAWSWVEFPDSSCDDGSATGVAVSPGTGTDLVVFLNGGGACWDYLTCYVLNTASHGPFGAAQFERLRTTALPGSILDRGLAGNPFADATLVFVPYCTGDIHGGDSVVTYTGPSDSRVHHHVGHANVLAFLRRLAATWPSPQRLVVAGASAGGFGALLNYDAFRHYWPAASAFLVDDSGPPLGPGAVSPQLLSAWYASWRLDRTLDPVCGSACRTDLSAQITGLSRRYPHDRLALLSSLQDQVISAYYQLSGAELEAALLRVTADVIGPTANFRAFLVAGSSHTMLGDPAAFSQGISLLGWLEQETSGDAAWSTRQP